MLYFIRASPNECCDKVAQFLDLRLCFHYKFITFVSDHAQLPFAPKNLSSQFNIHICFHTKGVKTNGLQYLAYGETIIGIELKHG